jgi:hypothetical protein
MKGGNLMSINLANGMPLPPGVYLLKVMMDGKLSKTIKLIKSN